VPGEQQGALAVMTVIYAEDPVLRFITRTTLPKALVYPVHHTTYHRTVEQPRMRCDAPCFGRRQQGNKAV